jgi:hypothetical protein
MNYVLSAILALIGPFPLLMALNYPGATPPMHGWAAMLGTFLIALGACLTQAIQPMIFGLLLGPGFAIDLWVMAGQRRSGNLMGLGLMLIFGFGLAIGVVAGIAGWAVRRRPVRAWIPVACVVAGILVILAGAIQDRLMAASDTERIGGFLREIGRAEEAYAAARPDHVYTCDGPALAGPPGIEWRTDYNLGGPLRNQGEHDRFWITLTCQPSARPQWFIARALAMWPNGPSVTWDSRLDK